MVLPHQMYPSSNRQLYSPSICSYFVKKIQEKVLFISVILHKYILFSSFDKTVTFSRKASQRAKDRLVSPVNSCGQHKHSSENMLKEEQNSFSHLWSPWRHEVVSYLLETNIIRTDAGSVGKRCILAKSCLYGNKPCYLKNGFSVFQIQGEMDKFVSHATHCSRWTKSLKEPRTQQ